MAITPPTMVASYESAVTTSGTSFGTITGIPVQNGDVLLVYGRSYDNSGADLLPNNPDSSGTEPIWTARQSIMISGYSSSRVWTGPVTVSETISVSLTGAAGISGHVKSFTVYVWRAHGGIGASNKANANGATPALTLAGVAANSAIWTGNSDWNAVAGARTPITSGAGAYTEETYDTGTDYVSYDGYHADSGAAGSKSLGWTAPTAQRYAMIAVEILGVEAAGAGSSRFLIAY